MLVRRDRVHPGRGAGRGGVRADVRLRAGGRRAGRWSASDWGAAQATDGETTISLHLRPADRDRGQSRACAPHAGRRASGGSSRSAGRTVSRGRRDLEDAEERMRQTEHYWRSWLAGGRFPDHRWRKALQRSALTLKGLTYAPTGATVAAADDLAAGDARGRAQLGLPLLLDARRDVHAVGAARARVRLGGRRLHAVRRRPPAQRRRRRCRSCTGSAASAT